MSRFTIDNEIISHIEKGILGYQHFKRFVKKKIISSKEPVEGWQFQPNTLDLRLGSIAYRVKSSFFSINDKVGDKIKELLMYEMDIEKGAILEKGSVYIIPLQECLDLPKYIHGKANAKSSIGRLDIFTRLITDSNNEYNLVKNGYFGNLYVEISPLSFNIKIRKNDSLIQLKLANSESIRLNREKLKQLYNETPLLFDNEGNSLPFDNATYENGLINRIDLFHENKEDIIGFKTKKNDTVIDISKKRCYKTEDFWERIYSNPDRQLILEPGVFYIFASKERVIIPDTVCGEMIPYDSISNEIQLHYGGFFDTGFGVEENGIIKGAKAVLELKSHTMPILLEDNQKLYRIFFDKNINIPAFSYGKSLNSSYQCQDLSLSKHFITN